MKIMVSITTQTFLRKSSILTVFVMCLSLLPTSSAGKTKDPAIEFDNINKEIKDSTPEDLSKIRTETGKTFLMLIIKHRDTSQIISIDVLKDDFLLLKKRYPDKTSLIEWAEKEPGIGK